jgi:hypothetical protein
MLFSGVTYGVMGMLERILEPRSPPGVAPPGAALRAGVLDFSADFEDEFAASIRRNCSLFIVAILDSLGAQSWVWRGTGEVEFEKGLASCDKNLSGYHSGPFQPHIPRGSYLSSSLPSI